MPYDLGTAHGKVEITYTGEGQVRKAKEDIEDLSSKSKSTDDQLKKFGKTLGKLGGMAGKGAGIGALSLAMVNTGAAAASATVQVLGMVPALASIGSLASALPGAFVAVAAAVGTVKAALAGMGDALTAAFDTESTKKFEEALKKLSPSAQAFAKSFKSDLVPGLRAFQQGIQEAFFKTNLQSLFPQITSAMGKLSPTLQGLAGQFAGLAKRIASFALESRTLGFVTDSVDVLRSGLANLAPVITPLLQALRGVGEVGLNALARLAGGVGTVTQSFTNWLNYLSSSGALEGFIDQAISTLQTLGDIAGNVGSILGNIFRAAEATGGGLLQTIESITGQFAEFLNSAEGSAAITSLFTGIMQVASALAPVFTTLAGALAGALGPALAQIATQVGPVLLQVVEALAPAFAPLAGAIANLLTAVAPLIPVIAQLAAIFVGQLANGLSVLATEVGPLISVLGGAFLSALQQLAPIMTTIATTALPLAAKAGAELAAALAPLAPVIVEVATAFASAILPVLPQLVASMGQLAPLVVQLAQAFAGSLAQGLQAIIPFIPALVNAFVLLASTLPAVLAVGLRFVTFMVSLATTVSGTVSAVVGAFTSFVSTVGSAFTSAYNTVVSVGGSVIAWFTGLPGRIGSALSALPGALVNSARNALNMMAFAVGAGIGAVITFFANLPGRASSAASSLVTTIGNVIRNTMTAARSAVTAGITAVVSFFSQLPGRAASAISSLPGRLRSIASTAMSNFRSAISSGINTAVSLASGIAGRIKGAVGNLGSALVGAGRDAVLGLVNGIRGAIGSAVSAAADVGRSVISGIKSTLKISSPSRVMRDMGRFINQGLVQGLQGTAKQVQAAANKVANYVRDAYSDKLLRGGTRTTVLRYISNANKQLLRLVNQGNTVAAKLKSAQANLKNVQDAYNKASADASTAVLKTFELVRPGENFVNLDRLKARLQATVVTAKQFATDMAALSKRGLNANFLQQLADAGSQQGAAMARALATASNEDIKQLNALQGQLNTAAGSVGKNVADALYGAGVRAAQGLVNGLKSQQKAIDKQMATIANNLAKAIKKALKIKSPSRVMFDLGKFISMGLYDGIRSLAGKVTTAARDLANSAIVPTVGLGAATPLSNAVRAVGSATAASTGVVLNQTVNALPGMSARQVSQYSASRLLLMARLGTVAASTATPFQEA